MGLLPARPGCCDTLLAKLLASNIKVKVITPPKGAKDATELRAQLGDSELFRSTMEWVALTLPVELAHCEGDTDEISEADRTQYNFWSVVAHVSEDISELAQFNEAEHWPPEALTTAATCFLTALVSSQRRIPIRIWSTLPAVAFCWEVTSEADLPLYIFPSQN